MRLSLEVEERFAAASGDFSPLHVSDSYGRTTPFGQPVAHGACAALACCGFFTPPAGSYPSALRVVFYRPLFRDLEYDLDLAQTSAERACFGLMDGSRRVMEAVVEYAPGVPPIAVLPGTPVAPRGVARLLSEGDLTGAWATEGSYSPGASRYLALLDTLGVQREAWGDGLPITLMAASYLTGMELPGERALFFRLRADLPQAPVELPGVLRQDLTEYGRRSGMVKSGFRLSGGGRVWSSGEMQAFLRPLRSPAARIPGGVSPEAAERFAGKTALVVGASRGFGSALALALAGAGATVVALYARSREDAEGLVAAAAGQPGRILPVQGDAGDPATCRQIRQRILSEHGRLDWLVCSAAPPLQPLHIEAAAFDRIGSFLRDGFALALAPLSAFLDLLSDSGGTALVVSSIAVENPPAIWPHYVALKSAVEGLVRVAAAEYPKASFCIARPAKLRTDLVNSPMASVDAEDPSVAAARILSDAALQARPGEVSYLK